MSSIGDEARKEKARETGKATLIESPQLPADDSSARDDNLSNHLK